MTMPEQYPDTLQLLRAAKFTMEQDIFRCTEEAIAKFKACTGMTPSAIRLDFYGTYKLGRLGEQKTEHRLASVKSDLDFDTL